MSDVSPGLTIGYDELRYSYPVRRNCAAAVPDVVHRRVERLPFDAVPPLNEWLFEGLFVPFRSHGVDLVHLWNRVSVGRTPWGVSYESRLPRIAGDDRRPRVRSALEGLLRRESCRFLAPISAYAEQRLRARLSADDAILGKIRQVPPHQDLLVDQAPGPVASDSSLQVVMIGHDFLRKGGEAVLDALDEVGEELDVQLTVVSSVARVDYACPDWPDERLDTVRRRLADHPRVTWHLGLTNPEVVALLTRSHLGLLPTLADTYGYSLLEFMACGLPVVGSTVQAGPEIVTDDVGWRVQVDVDDQGDWVGLQTPRRLRDRQYEEARAQVATQLAATLREVRAQPAATAARGLAGWQRVGQVYGVDRAQRMRAVYAEALAR